MKCGLEDQKGAIRFNYPEVQIIIDGLKIILNKNITCSASFIFVT